MVLARSDFLVLIVWSVDISSVLTTASVCIMTGRLYFCIAVSVLFGNLRLQHSKKCCKVQNDTLVYSLIFVLKFLKKLVLFGNKSLNKIDLLFLKTVSKTVRKKKYLVQLSQLISSNDKKIKLFFSDKKKPKSERLFGLIYLKIVCSFRINFIWKYLLFGITLKKVSIISQ